MFNDQIKVKKVIKKEENLNQFIRQTKIEFTGQMKMIGKINTEENI